MQRQVSAALKRGMRAAPGPDAGCLPPQAAGEKAAVLPGEAVSVALLADTVDAVSKYITPDELLRLIEAERTRLGKVTFERLGPQSRKP